MLHIFFEILLKVIVLEGNIKDSVILLPMQCAFIQALVLRDVLRVSYYEGIFAISGHVLSVCKCIRHVDAPITVRPLQIL